MAQGMYHKLRQIWKKPDKELLQQRLIEWRKSNATTVVKKPLRLDRARALGYKAKKGFVIVRVKIGRGGRKRKRAGTKGRSTRKQTIRKTLKMNYKWVAEIRASRKYKNLEVLNSYWIGQDGKYYFFEIIMVDPSVPEIKSDKDVGWMSSGVQKKRAERGLTSSGRKSRGLRYKSPKKRTKTSPNTRGRKGK